MRRLDSRLRAATLQQLARRRELLLAGATHVGWKLGLGERERIGASVAVGHITSATLLAPGATYSMGGLAADLRADVELAVRLGPRLTVASYGVALEIVDLAPVLTTPEAVVATNIFHRAVALADAKSTVPRAVVASASVRGRERARGEAAVHDVAARIDQAASILKAAGEQMIEGDWVITGSIVQIPIEPGDEVKGVIERLGAITVQVAL